MRRALCLLGVVAVCWVAAPSSFGTADVQGFMAAIPAVFNARAPAPAMQVGPIYEKQRKSSTITTAKSFESHNNLEELTTLDWATGAVYRPGNAYATYPTYSASPYSAYTRDGAQPQPSSGWTSYGVGPMYSRRPAEPNAHPAMQQTWAAPFRDDAGRLQGTGGAGAPPMPQAVNDEAAKQAWLAQQEAPPQAQAPPKAPPSVKGVVAHTRIPPIPTWGKMQQNPTKQGKPDHKWAYGNTDWKNAVDYTSIRPKPAGGPRDFTDHTWATGPNGRATSPYV